MHDSSFYCSVKLLRMYVCVFMHARMYVRTHACMVMHSSTHSLTHSLTHSRIHSVSQSLIHAQRRTRRARERPLVLLAGSGVGFAFLRDAHTGFRDRAVRKVFCAIYS